MSDLNDQEQLRDSIADILELSRESWKKENTSNALNDDQEQPFPRSFLFKALNQHPLLSAAAVTSVWYLGPAKFGAMAVAGASLFLRHRDSILPIVQQVLSAALFKSKDDRGKNENANAGDGKPNNNNNGLDSNVKLDKPLPDIDRRTQ
jgi:hypothetical protein